MKKLLLLLAVLCGTVSGWAQSYVLTSSPSKTLNSVEGISDSKFYVLQTADEYGMNLFLKDESAMKVDNQLKIYDTASQKYLWKIIKNGDNYSFKNVATGNFFPTIVKNQTPNTVEEANAGLFVLEDRSSDGQGKWNIKNTNDDVRLNVRGWYGWTSADVVGWDTGGGNSNYVIYEVDVADVNSTPQYDVTFNYYEGETLLVSKTEKHYSGRNLAIAEIPALDFFTMTFKTEGDHIVVEDAVFDINCTPNFPFEPATINASGCVEGKWYKLTQGSYKIAYTYNGNGIANSGSDDDTHRVDFVDDNSNAKGYWAFVRVPGTIKFNIYNLGRPGVPMAVVKHANQGNKDNYNWGMLYMDYKDGSITDFVISKNGNYFNIQIPAEQINNNYATCGNHINGHFGFWSMSGTNPITSGGSQLAVEEVLVSELEVAISNAKTDFKKALWGDEFPYANSSYDGTYINSFKDLDAVLEAATSVDDLNTTKQELLDNSQYYRIRMYNAGRYKQHSEKWYVSGSKVAENGNENSLFVYNALNKTLKQVSTGNFLVHGKELKGQGDDKCYSLTENITNASTFSFTPSTREGLTHAWSVYDGFGNMADWGHTNNVFSLHTPDDDWATWAVEIETQPVTGKFYILKGSNGKYLTIDGANTGNTTLQTSTDKDASTIFYFEPGSEDAKFYMVSFKNGNYVANPYRNGVGTATIPSNNGETEIYKQEWNLVDAAERQYKLFYAGQYYLGVNGDATNGDANGEGEAYCWSLVPVKVLPVTITSAEYATFYAPCNVTLPSGLTAYYVSNTGNGYATLTKIEGDVVVVPANTGVLLQGAANTYNLTIGGEAADVESMLEGTVASEYISKTSYVLSKQNEVVGFYKALMNQQGGTFLNNGFRAYLPAGDNNARSLVFDFGGTETGIDELKGENGNVKAEVYDLAGRRVLNAKKGVFVVNGKVIVK